VYRSFKPLRASSFWRQAVLFYGWSPSPKSDRFVRRGRPMVPSSPRSAPHGERSRWCLAVRSTRHVMALLPRFKFRYLLIYTYTHVKKKGISSDQVHGKGRFPRVSILGIVLSLDLTGPLVWRHGVVSSLALELDCRIPARFIIRGVLLTICSI
jgi:hypothetical protein